ncbi:MAG: class I SAM-dependent methyltransferase [Proteobacteria bacterium]|nr:class I SAM-dependent methyltransferase [Pseudomonadota bacterium]
MNDVNQRAMATREAVAQYLAASELTLPERAALDELAADVRQRPILDLGVGGGRTVAPLRAISLDYTGIDYAPAMVAATLARHPDAKIEHADACDLSRYPEGHFKLVVFSCNGIGMVSHGDRLRILAAVRRVLAPDGHFVFSNHNRRARVHHRIFELPTFEHGGVSLRSVVRAARFVRHTATRAVNRARNYRRQVATADYAIVNGASHHYGVMLYLIDVVQQHRQLEAAGFVPHTAFDLAGRRVTVDDDPHDDSILYVARKA